MLVICNNRDRCKVDMCPHYNEHSVLPYGSDTCENSNVGCHNGDRCPRKCGQTRKCEPTFIEIVKGVINGEL